MNNETIEFKGKLYEIGKYYEFRDNDRLGWIVDKLTEFINDEDDPFNFETEHSYYKQIRTIEPNRLGTVKDKPVELIDGEAYVFDYNNEKSCKGIYCEYSERFHNVGWFDKGSCTNIRRLVEK